MTTTNTKPAQIDLKPLTAAQLDKARQTLAAGRHKARQAAPYFQHILLKLVPREVPPSPDFCTVGVTDKLIMLCCMEYVATLTPDTMAGDWLHECLHVLKDHGKRRGKRDPQQWNEAADLAINTIVRDMGVKQTPIALWPKDYGFSENEAADTYYALLDKQRKSGKKPSKGPAGRPQPGGGHCGSCAGHAVKGEPAAGDPEERSDADIEVAVRETALAIKAQASKTKGSIPAGLLLFAEEALQPAQVPWQAKLGRAIRGAAAWTSGSVDTCYDRPGRRQACLGYGVGRPVLPRYRKPLPRVAVVLDTSGSMGAGEGSPLQAGVVETMGIVKALGADVDFIAVDARVNAAKKLHSVAELLGCLKGGGGTSFVPGFEAVAALRPRPHVMVYATDGYGDAPAQPPRGIKVIWLIIGGGPKPATWGEEIRIES